MSRRVGDTIRLVHEHSQRLRRIKSFPGCDHLNIRPQSVPLHEVYWSIKYTGATGVSAWRTRLSFSLLHDCLYTACNCWAGQAHWLIAAMHLHYNWIWSYINGFLSVSDDSISKDDIAQIIASSCLFVYALFITCTRLNMNNIVIVICTQSTK